MPVACATLNLHNFKRPVSCFLLLPRIVRKRRVDYSGAEEEEENEEEEEVISRIMVNR